MRTSNRRTSRRVGPFRINRDGLRVTSVTSRHPLLWWRRITWWSAR